MSMAVRAFGDYVPILANEQQSSLLPQLQIIIVLIVHAFI